MVANVAPYGWHLQFYAPGYIVRDLIDFLGTLEIDFMIDHMGYMLEEDGLTEADFQRLLALMQNGYGWLKMSAPYRLAKSSEERRVGKGYVITCRSLWSPVH